MTILDKNQWVEVCCATLRIRVKRDVLEVGSVSCWDRFCRRREPPLCGLKKAVVGWLQYITNRQLTRNIDSCRSAHTLTALRVE